MVVFDDRRGYNIPIIEQQEQNVMLNSSYLVNMIEILMKYELEKNETETYNTRVKMVKSMRFLQEDIEKLRELYKRNGIK